MGEDKGISLSSYLQIWMQRCCAFGNLHLRRIAQVNRLYSRNR